MSCFACSSPNSSVASRPIPHRSAVASRRSIPPCSIVFSSKLIVAEARRVRRLAWDTSFSVRTILDGRIAAVSSVNLVENTGIGADATRTTFADDFVATLPASDRIPRGDGTPSELDPSFDRSSLLAELVARCVRPEIASRLARLLRAQPEAPLDAATRLHLAPFLHSEETLAILDRLSEHGASGPRFEMVRSTLRRLAEERVP